MRLIPADRLDEERQILEKINRGARTKPFETLATDQGRAAD